MKNVKHRMRVILITLSFLLPFALAAWCYQHAYLFQFKTTNLGHLFVKPVAISGPWTKNDGPWQIVYWPREGAMADPVASQKLLYQLHQMRIALGRSEKQLPISLVLPPNCVGSSLCQQKQSIEKSGIQVIQANNDDFVQQLSPTDAKNIAQHADAKVYLIDPQGFFFMYYEEKEDPLNILQDLKHLWEVSSSG
ncbi:MAG: hypothetical protein K2Q33_06540 [Gammaproteobacteria bacterium]|nr:hypothetical protein [Gammaproteobacteria bacterium]